MVEKLFDIYIPQTKFFSIMHLFWLFCPMNLASSYGNVRTDVYVSP